MKCIFVTVFILSGGLAFCHQRQLPSTAPQKLTKTVGVLLAIDSFPKSDFKNIPIKYVVEFLQKNHAKTGSSSGISYVIIPSSQNNILSFTGSFTGMNLSQALETLCSQIDLYWWITSSAIVIAPKQFHTAEQGAAANP